MSNHFDSIFQNNTGYVEEIFQKYIQDPQSVDNEWQAYFGGFQEGFNVASALASHSTQYESLLKTIFTSTQSCETDAFKEVTKQSYLESINFEFKVARYVQAWKTFGHLYAGINPLQKVQPVIPELELSSYHFLPSDLFKTTQAGILIGLNSVSTLNQLTQNIIKLYTSSVGIEIEHIFSQEERLWLENECLKIHEPVEKEIQKFIYTELACADAFEKTIATKYVGRKRFSIEGADSLYPAVESFLDESAKLGMKECTVAISHRGRLNFLVNVIKKPLEEMFAEWEGYPHDGLKGGCDVKYHYGYESKRTTRSGYSMRISMPFNPSHLEYVSPIAMGDTRARQVLYHESNSSKVGSIIFHGDAAISGQGIVFETAQMMSLDGYKIGGTVHVVANNQIGFTTDPKDSRSSKYCTDVAKVTNSPVFHVNGDDLDAVHNVMILAARYRHQFKKDIYIDILCFRRYGHNESDEPTFTQPLLYKIIKEKLAPFEEYMNYLSASFGFSQEDLKRIYANLRSEMNLIYDKVKKEHLKINQFIQPRDISNIVVMPSEQCLLNEVNTKVSIDKIKELANKITEIPSGFHINTKLSRIIIAERKDMAEGKKPIDWGMAELLAYASLLNEGHSVRLVGEDAQRGTFSHRHVTLVDSENASKITPLANACYNSQVEIINSLLSEEAAMGYEYGYSVRNPQALVIWEGQFGDFANGAQVIIDQFISSGETKWHQPQGLVLLLPHGLEGMGPEHSSARLERFLQLCAENNMFVCYFTSAKQIFHALRRQIQASYRKPLIIMSPKSFLRSSRVLCSFDDLANGCFEEILNDSRIQKAELVEKVVFCSGKIALDLFDTIEKEDFKNRDQKIAIIRIEQLYPFNYKKALDILSQYKNVKIVAWAQEEPANMGAWSFIRSYLDDLCIDLKLKSVVYFGRSKRASPAVGLEKVHKEEQENLMKSVMLENYSVLI